MVRERLKEFLQGRLIPIPGRSILSIVAPAVNGSPMPLCAHRIPRSISCVDSEPTYLSGYERKAERHLLGMAPGGQAALRRSCSARRPPTRTGVSDRPGGGSDNGCERAGQIQMQTVKLNGHALDYDVTRAREGDADRPPLLLLSGWCQDHRLFTPV